MAVIVYMKREVSGPEGAATVKNACAATHRVSLADIAASSCPFAKQDVEAELLCCTTLGLYVVLRIAP